MTYTTVTPTQMVGMRVREIRTRRGLTAQQVADKCAEVGNARLSREIIANLEQGRRASLGIEELLVLAYVLNVPPVLLMTPVGTEDHLQITPELAWPPIQALTWMTGEHISVDTPSKDVAPIRLARRWFRAWLDLMEARDGNDPERFRKAEAEFNTVIEIMDDAGMPAEFPLGQSVHMRGTSHGRS